MLSNKPHQKRLAILGSMSLTIVFGNPWCLKIWAIKIHDMWSALIVFFTGMKSCLLAKPFYYGPNTIIPQIKDKIHGNAFPWCRGDMCRLKESGSLVPVILNLLTYQTFCNKLVNIFLHFRPKEESFNSFGGGEDTSVSNVRWRENVT